MQEAKLRGPHPFPLERLLSICWALLDADAAASDEAPPLDGVERQSAEAFMQISSLVSLQLLSQARCFLLALSLDRDPGCAAMMADYNLRHGDGLCLRCGSQGGLPC